MDKISLKSIATKYAVLLIIAVFSLQSPRVEAQSGVYFDESHAEQLRLGNAAYELVLSKENGAILGITDKRHGGASLTLGSRGGCLWGGVFRDAGDTENYVGGCFFGAIQSNRFTYDWNSADSTLLLDYRWDSLAARGVNAQVSITLTPEAYFDMQLDIQNQWGYVLQNALFPSDFLFN